MKDLPPAANLLNFYQFAKVYESDVTSNSEGSSQKLRAEHLERRKTSYLDPKPRTEKPKEKCLFAVYYTVDETEKRFDYLTARFFYCHYYEKLAKETAEFKRLTTDLARGLTLEIWSYHVYSEQTSYEIKAEDLYDYYMNINKPFNFEIMLYCLLTISDSKNYPWNLYRAQHPELYENFGL